MRHSLLAAVSVLAILSAPALANAQADGGSVRVGQSVSGNTDDDGRDYTLTLNAGDGIEVIMRSDDIDSLLEIYGPSDSDEPLAMDDDGLGDGLHSRLRFMPSESGTYRIRAKSLSEAGNFSLSVQRWRPTPVRSININRGREVRGQINNRSSQDNDGNKFQQYRLNLSQGERVAIKVEANDIDPIVRIGRETDGVFEELGVNDDAPGAGLNSQLNFSAPTSGTYAIRVGSVSGSDGPFTITVEDAAPLAPPTPIVIGESVAGELSDKTPTGMSGVRADRYALQVVEGQAYEITMTGDGFDAFLNVYDEAGTEVASDDDSAGDLNPSLLLTPKASGTYIIEARGLSDANGAYTLEVESVEPPPPPQPLAMGQEVEGELTDDDARLKGNARFDGYSFTATEGQRLQITMTSSEFDAVLEVGKAEGTFEALASDDDGMGQGTNARLTFDVPEDGEYIIRAQSFDDGRGAYQLRLTDRGPEPESGSLLIGSTVRGSLGENDNTSNEGRFGGGYYDDYTFAARKDEKLRFILVAPKFDAVVLVGQKSGSSTSFSKQDDDGLSDTHSRLIWTAPRDGDYVVRVTSFGPNATGDYSLIVERQP